MDSVKFSRENINSMNNGRNLNLMNKCLLVRILALHYSNYSCIIVQYVIHLTVYSTRA